jgi:hypothetical protein
MGVFEFMGDCIYEGIVLLVTPDLTNEESGVEHEAKMRTTKKTMPSINRTTSLVLRRIHPTFNATARATRQAPSVMKKAIDFLRRPLTRIGETNIGPIRL